MKNILLFIVCLVTISTTSIQAQTTAIPDPAFEQKLISLGIDSDGLVNGIILNSDASNATNLNVDSSNINSLVGLEAFINITNLSCRANNLTTLDISNNLALQSIFCEDNNLTALDPSLNINLREIVCYANDIASLDVTQNTLLWGLTCGGNSRIDTLDMSKNTLLTQFNCDGTNLRELDLTHSPNLGFVFCRANKLTKLQLPSSTIVSLVADANEPNLIICVPDVQVASMQGGWQRDASSILSDNCFPKAVEGRLVIDSNNNCIADNMEVGLNGQLIRFEHTTSNQTLYAVTYNTNGDYIAFLDTGTYVVDVLPSSPYWQTCLPTQQVSINNNYVIQTLNWAVQSTTSCAFLEVDIAAPFLRMTGGGSAYTVSYCNNGSATAQNAYVKVSLDADLNFISSTIPIASQNGSVYTFNIGNIAMGQCGSFDMQVVVDTSSLFQQTHCTKVHIYPDSICIPLDTTPIVRGDVNCQNDSIFFRINNEGTNMLQPQRYYIFEDNIAMRTGTIQLNGGTDTLLVQPTIAGATYRIEVQQLPNFPDIIGDSVYSAVIEGCNTLADGSFNTGFVTQFSNGLSSPFEAIDCQQNIASYDPNDKSAQPLGYDTDHYIYENTTIDYKVRFQNTGTDTAFNIVILDTISPYLEVNSIKMGASSHNYTWTIDDGNILKINFNNILLVDSNANEPLSHGFFRYRIEQKANNPLGSVINNQAAIYFDYNPPIFTNTTFHTIGEDFVTTTVSVDYIYEDKLQVKAFPNPFTHSTTIKVEGKEYEALELGIYDLLGRKMAHKQATFSNQIQLERGNLQTGIYIYRLIGDKQIISSGKIRVD